MKITNVSVEYAVRHIPWPQEGALSAIAICLVIQGTYRSRSYAAVFDAMVQKGGLSRVRVYSEVPGADGARKEHGGVLRERFYTLGCTLAEAWRATPAYDAAYLACVRKDLVMSVQNLDGYAAHLTAQLRETKRFRAKARRALAAFDKKHPHPQEIPFG